MHQITFLNTKCNIKFSRYIAGNRLAIMLTVDGTGESFATASINVPDVSLKDNEVVIKNYSELEGLLDALVAEGIVEKTGKVVQLNHVTADICRLMISPTI